LTWAFLIYLYKKIMSGRDFHKSPEFLPLCLGMLKISGRFWIAVKTSRMKGYEIANLAGIHPSTLSKLLWEVKTVRPDDHRVIAVAKVLGLSPEECFEEVVKEQRF
jgi:hypothetical protein